MVRRNRRFEHAQRRFRSSLALVEEKPSLDQQGLVAASYDAVHESYSKLGCNVVLNEPKEGRGMPSCCCSFSCQHMSRKHVAIDFRLIREIWTLWPGIIRVRIVVIGGGSMIERFLVVKIETYSYDDVTNKEKRK